MAISKITGSALGKDLIMKDVATADGSSPTLTLQTGDTACKSNSRTRSSYSNTGRIKTLEDG